MPPVQHAVGRKVWNIAETGSSNETFKLIIVQAMHCSFDENMPSNKDWTYLQRLRAYILNLSKWYSESPGGVPMPNCFDCLLFRSLNSYCSHSISNYWHSTLILILRIAAQHLPLPPFHFPPQRFLHFCSKLWLWFWKALDSCIMHILELNVTLEGFPGRSHQSHLSWKFLTNPWSSAEAHFPKSVPYFVSFWTFRTLVSTLNVIKQKVYQLFQIRSSTVLIGAICGNPASWWDRRHCPGAGGT